MQYDMHFFATYALAVAAGIPADDARIIAGSSQFVDDHKFEDLVTLDTGEGVLGVPTAHHPLEAGIRAKFPSVEEDDCRLVWVPFHFLPGNQGATFHERILARKDSAIARKMLDYYLQPDTVEAHRDHMLHLMGIAAHVYADTFSHYGFSGISSPLNDIPQESISVSEDHSKSIREYLQARFEQFKADFGRLADLGHGAVGTYPDRPYLKWSFRYRSGEVSERDNPATFLEACTALHARFSQFAAVYYDKAPPPVATWTDIEGAVREILRLEDGADGRAQEWRESMSGARLGPAHDAPTYDPEVWLKELRAFGHGTDVPSMLKSNGYRFFAAAQYHRDYVLKRLLPGEGMLVA